MIVICKECQGWKGWFYTDENWIVCTECDGVGEWDDGTDAESESEEQSRGEPMRGE